jgi:Zn-dependent protease
MGYKTGMHESIIQTLLLIIPILLSITVHEVCHGYAAYYFGDPTAKRAGRLTLNPIKHIDIWGLLFLLITRLIGWAKPVPVDPRYFKRPRQDMLWVALAGPASNLLLAFGFALVWKFFGDMIPANGFWAPTGVMLQLMIAINVGLAIFNLIPIPPLDGGRVVAGLLSDRNAWRWERLEPWGFLIVLALLLTNVIDVVLYPLIRGVIGFLLSL